MSASHAPQQLRSRRTEQRLVEATLSLLQEGGLAACTVPAVAERAGVAVGSVYRRYPDKQAMVGSAILALFSVPPEAERQYVAIVEESSDLDDFLRRLTLSTIIATQHNRTLVLATRDFARLTTDEAWLSDYRRLRGRARTLVLDAAIERFRAELPGGDAPLRLALAAIYGAVEVVFIEPIPGLYETPPDPEMFALELAALQARSLRGLTAESAVRARGPTSA